MQFKPFSQFSRWVSLNGVRRSLKGSLKGNYHELRMCELSIATQSRSQSPRSLWSAETTRLDLWDNPKPEAKFWLPVSRAHVRACSKVYKVSMRKGYIPGRKGAKLRETYVFATRTHSSMYSDDRCQSPRRTRSLGSSFQVALHVVRSYSNLWEQKNQIMWNCWFNF